MENKQSAFEKPEERTQGLTRRQLQKPASAEEARGDYGDTVIESERDEQQRNYKGTLLDEEPATPGVQIHRGRVEHYNDKTASENQGR